MSGRRQKHDSQASVAPILPHEQEDPFVRDAQPRKRGKKKEKEGWFTGKITWVVFACTIVQLVVFIAMLVKNGEAMLRSCDYEACVLIVPQDSQQGRPS